MTQRDPYAVLGVTAHASADEIAAAHRSLARRFHPDVSKDPHAQDRMAEINGAWAILRDPARRAEWDAANRPGGAARGDRAAAHGTGGQGASRSGTGGGFPAASSGVATWRRGPDGEGAAGPPPGPRMGSVLPFGRHIGWSIGEIARVDPGYLVWVKDRREAAPFRAEIEKVLTGMFPAAARTIAPPARRRRWG